MGDDGRKATQELAIKTITADSAWEKAQGMKHIKPSLNDKVEVEIPNVISLSKEGDNYLIYVHINDGVIRLSNIEGVGNSGCGSIQGVNDGEEHTRIPE